MWQAFKRRSLIRRSRSAVSNWQLAKTKSKTFDAEEQRQQRIGEVNNFNTEEPEKKKTEDP